MRRNKDVDQFSLCLPIISVSIFGGAGSEGAAAPILARTNSNHDQRQPKRITVESFSNNQLDSRNSDNIGILPSSSRETTPMTAETLQLAEYVDEKGFFSGNPFVEVTKGIIHIYKRK